MFFTNLETSRLHLQNLGPAHRYFIYVLFTNDDVLRFNYEEDRYGNLRGADAEIAEWNQPEPRNQHGWVLVRKTDGVARVCASSITGIEAPRSAKSTLIYTWISGATDI